MHSTNKQATSTPCRGFRQSAVAFIKINPACIRTLQPASTTSLKPGRATSSHGRTHTCLTCSCSTVVLRVTHSSAGYMYMYCSRSLPCHCPTHWHCPQIPATIAHCFFPLPVLFFPLADRLIASMYKGVYTLKLSFHPALPIYSFTSHLLSLVSNIEFSFPPFLSEQFCECTCCLCHRLPKTVVCSK